jgi:glycerophosphoryl diester phosphodiesterase
VKNFPKGTIFAFLTIAIMRTTLTFLMMIFGCVSMAQNFYIAHRGASYLAPENTVASAKLAWELGADAVECDVHLSADNRVMVIHDKDTRRTCNGKSFKIADTPSVVLRDLDAGSWKDPKYKGEHIPYLEEIIATVPEGKTLVVEIKSGSDVIPHMERILRKCKSKPEIIFIAFGWETIVDAKKAFPENRCYWLSGSKQAALGKLQQIRDLKIEGINMQYSAVDEELIGKARELGLDVLVWTMDDPQEAKRLAALGITHFTTNRPDWLKQQMAQ